MVATMGMKTLNLRQKARSCLFVGAIFVSAPAHSAPQSLNRIQANLDNAEKTMIVDPAQVVPIARTSRRQLETMPVRRNIVLARIRALWLEGEALGRLNEIDAAGSCINTALSEIERTDPHSQLHGRILMSHGAIALDSGQVQVAFLDYRKAFEMFRRVGDARNQALALQNIGSIYSDAGDQQSVLRYYAQSADLFPADTGLAVSARNNVGLAYKEIGDFGHAEEQYRLALTLAAKLKSASLEARILNNIGAVQLARGQLVAADRTADHGLAVARNGASEWSPFLWGLKAQVALARGDARAAVSLLERTFAGTDLTKTSFYYRDFHKTAVDAYTLVGDETSTLLHLRAFKRLDDEAREIRSSTNAALNAAQFDSNNQQLKITKLQAGQLLRDVAIGRARARLNSLMLVTSLLLLVMALIAFFWIRRSRDQTRAANVQLEASNASLDKALRAKSEFLATTSHEIRTPLNGIMGMAQVLLGGKTLIDTDRERVNLINVAGTTMKAIVDDILDMAKIESGRIDVQKAPLDLNRLLKEVGDLWQAEAANKGIALNLDLNASPSWIVSDERKIRQIVFNLVSNAVKFTDNGFVTLRAGVAKGVGQEELCITVADTGIGISSDHLEEVFDPFFQVEGGMTRKVGGTGLGLAICSNLAGALGGTVNVESKPGHGSSFKLLLPLELHHTVLQGVPRASGHTGTLDEASVIIVESNALFRSIYAASLQGKVGSIVSVANLDEALTVMDASPADLLVVDYATVSDGENAEAALRRCRAPNPLAPILVLSAADANGADELVASGAGSVVLRKTMPPTGLTEALASMFAEVTEKERQIELSRGANY